MWDGIIIGGGLSGLLAGIRAAERGKQVLIISEGAGSLPYTSATLNVGDIHKLAGKPLHPYAIIGSENVRRAYRYFLKMFPRYTGEWGKTTAVLTPLGDVREAEITLKHLETHPLERAERIILLVPAGLKDFFPDLFLANLKEHYPHAQVMVKDVRVSAFETWYTMGKSVTALDYCRFWHSAEGLDTLRDILVSVSTDVSQAEQAGLPVVIFPGLGTDFSPAVEEILDTFPFTVVEPTIFPPSPLGALFYEELKARFKALGGEVINGGRVIGAEIEGSVCRRVKVASAGKELFFAGKLFVLAGGGLFGGGIVSYPGSLREPVFDLPLYRPTGWTQEDFLGEQPYAYTGVEVDTDLRPLDQEGQVVFTNLKVCGRMLGHWDPWTEHCGGGVSLASGYLAGEMI